MIPHDDDFFAPQRPQGAAPQPLAAQPVCAGASAYAQVAVQGPLERFLTYAIPPASIEELEEGALVEVPLGRRTVAGCIVGIDREPPEGIPSQKIRPVRRRLNPGYVVPRELLDLAAWMSEYYLCTPGEAVACVSFIGFQGVGAHEVIEFDAVSGAPDPPRLTANQRRALEVLRATAGPVSSAELQDAAGVTLATVRTLVRRGLVREERRVQERTDEYDGVTAPERIVTLNEAQSFAVEHITTAMRARRHQTFVLHGVTGSGKTEVYQRAVQDALDAGGEAIVLVPEIALTPQTVGRFRARFGPLVGVYHSRLSIGQKFDLHRRIASGDCRVLIGARSALFAPFPSLRLIVIDEEHESSYKQDSAPRYHARDTAIVRAHRLGAAVVLGSATPSLDAYQRAREGKFNLVTLPDRVDARPMPPVEILDMTAEVRSDASTDLFSAPLLAALHATLDAGQQAVVLLNRRGFFNFCVCPSCKAALKCQHCDVALTHHKHRGVLLCHYCGWSCPVPEVCPACGSGGLSLIGVGTQRLEERLLELFPGKTVLRLDMDSTRTRNAMLDAWRRIDSGEVDLILGTQIIAKGLHLEDVTLVAVPLADVSLFQPDFRAAERAFSLLTQVSGRAGRGASPGRVIIQTYVPHHYALEFVQRHDYIGFFEKEIRMRRLMRFPPFARLASVLIDSTNASNAATKAQHLAHFLKDGALTGGGEVQVLGPTPAPIARLEDRYRWRLLLRSHAQGPIRELLRYALARFHETPRASTVRVTVDVDPQDLL